MTFCTLSSLCGIAYLITKQLLSFQVGKFAALLCSALGPVKICRCPEGTYCWLVSCGIGEVQVLSDRRIKALGRGLCFNDSLG